MELTKNIELNHLEAQNNMAHMSAYYRWSLDFCGNKLGKNIWDAGAGIGIVADLIKNKADKLLLTEYGEENLKLLRYKYANNEKISIYFCDLTSATTSELKGFSPDFIIHLDVLEHLPDESHPLSLFYNSLQKGGFALIKVPAHPSLFCEMDKASLHYRRYTIKSLRKVLENEGFKVEKIKYMNAMGALLYFIKGKMLKRKTNFSNTFSKSRFGLMNGMIPVLKAIEKIIPSPFGLSVIALAKKE